MLAVLDETPLDRLAEEFEESLGGHTRRSSGVTLLSSVAVEAGRVQAVQARRPWALAALAAKGSAERAISGAVP